MGLVRVAEYGDLVSANGARMKLESAGIPCFLTNENLASMHWIYGCAGGIGLLVPESEAEDAGLLLSVDVPAVTPDGASEPGLFLDEAVCPECGGQGAPGIHWGKAFMLLSLLFGYPFPLRGQRYRCRHCGHAWKE